MASTVESTAVAAGTPSGRREVHAFLDTLQGVPPHTLTACQGWTAHEVVAHLTAGAELLTAQARAHVEGRTAPRSTTGRPTNSPTRSWTTEYCVTGWKPANRR